MIGERALIYYPAAYKVHGSLLCETMRRRYLGNGCSFAMLFNSFALNLPCRKAEHVTSSKARQLCGYSACGT